MQLDEFVVQPACDETRLTPIVCPQDTTVRNLSLNRIQIVLQWALQVGIVPLVGPSQHAHMENGVATAKRFTGTISGACRRVTHGDQDTCAELSVEGGLSAFFEDSQLGEIQNIGGVPPSTHSGRQRQRRGQAPKPLANNKDSAASRGTGHKPRLLLMSDDHGE